MSEQMPSIENIPIIDNHCHPGSIEDAEGLNKALSLRDIREISLQAYLQTAYSPDEYNLIKEALKLPDKEKIETLDSKFGFKKLLSDYAHFTSRTNLYEILHEQAFQDIYWPTESDRELEKRIEEQRKLGLVQSYIDILDRSGISIALHNTYTHEHEK